MFLLDSHCDTPSQIQRLRDLNKDNLRAHVDFPKMQKGGVGAAFFALYTPASFDSDKARAHADELLQLTLGAIEASNGVAVLAGSPAECLQAHADGRIAICIGMENGSPLGTDLGLLEHYYAQGVRYLTLCHSRDNAICDSCAQGSTWHGLSPFGRSVIAEMNRLGMMIDVSHISDESFYDVLEASKAPVVATHSCCRALASHPRNMTDDMIRALAAKGGVIQINFYPAFLSDEWAEQQRSNPFYDYADSVEEAFIADPADEARRTAWDAAQVVMLNLPRPSFTRIADHIDHVVSLVGIDHVGLGSDFDGICVPPEGLEDCSRFPLLLNELRSRGYSSSAISAIAGGNFLRLWGEVINMKQ